ncbi:MAG: MarR family EPS-associated transcriptional regulator [Proteobacteria bacterium]|nr:MarR family EPS-associated transcriptional regulator [Pseudomonadota bacterium]
MKESQFKALLEISTENEMTQRVLSSRLGLSLGSVNYIIKALIQKGYVKAKRFKNSSNKIGYMYILTPEGMKEKINQTETFMQRKREEYERLKAEMDTLNGFVDPHD